MAPEGVTIRPARRGDARGFARHLRSVAAEERSWRADPSDLTVAAARRLVARSWTSDHAVIVAVAQGEVVGSIGLVRERHAASRHVATFELAVDAGWRRRGVGAAILARGLEWAREVGVEKLLLSVYPANTAAIALYRRFGFIEEGRLSRHSRRSYGDEDEILMAAWVDRKEQG